MDEGLIERREYKYVISEERASRVQEFIRPYCRIDPFAESSGGHYTIDSLYVDSPGLKLYKANEVEDPNRFKLRIRHYPFSDDDLHFFEVKRRIRDVVSKSRAKVRGDWRRVLRNPADLSPISFKQRDEEAIRRFLDYYTILRCRPVVNVRYDRQPYFSPDDDYARVTFDRRVRYRPAYDLEGKADMPWRRVDDPVAMREAGTESLVVLELKFVAAVAPHWMVQLVEALDLSRQSFSKYGRSVENMYWLPTSPRIAHLRKVS